MAQRQRQGDEDVEQQRHLELVAEAIADLGGTGGPVRLTQRDVLDLGLTTDKRLPARPGHPQQQPEGKAHENEDRQQNRLNRHWNSPPKVSPRSRASPRYNDRTRL